MFARSPQKETTTSPADELFYKGKLLPLHLPPRLQMVEKLLQDKTYDEFFSTPLATNAHTTPTMNTPFQSCNISPSDSCQISRELDREEYFLEGLTKTNEFIGEIPKKSWRRKLKASRDYLKSLFIKSSYTNEAPARGLENGAFQKAKESAKNTTFGQIKEAVKMRRTTAEKKFVKDCGGGNHRRSFSGAIKRFSTSSSSLFPSGSSSSSSSSTSNNFHELQL